MVLQICFLQFNQKQSQHVTGNAGGGRDKPDKKAKLIAEKSDIMIVTNEDPYDDDPEKIIDEVVDGALKDGKKLDEDLFKILDRRKAINFALKKAQMGDIVLITGKGSEQLIMTGPVGSGIGIEWDDRKVVREELKKL